MAEIRSYKDKDFQKVQEVLEKTSLLVPEVDKKERFRDKIKYEPHSIKVAEQENQVIGCIFITNDATNVLVTRLGVLPEFQGQGIGTKLLNAAENWLKEKEVNISVVFAERTNAELNSWYERRGYKEKGEYKMLMKDL